MMLITPLSLVLLFSAILAVAILYSSVGHGGASGYIAMMALFSIPLQLIKPTALVLNILVSLIAVYAYSKAGHFRWKLFWPFAVSSIPFSFLGGSLHLPPNYIKPTLGIILLLSAWRILFEKTDGEKAVSEPPVMIAGLIGAALGLLSGLTGVGGGIFLSPILLTFGWAEAKETSGIAALFILVNSIAGILGHMSSLGMIPAAAGYFALAAMVGGSIGSFLGSRVLPAEAIFKALSVVLTIAGFKLIFV